MLNTTRNWSKTVGRTVPHTCEIMSSSNTCSDATGIAYGDMQLIAEVHDMLKRDIDISEDEIADVGTRRNKVALTASSLKSPLTSSSSRTRIVSR